MRTVFIEFTSPKSWFAPYSWLIRLFECTKYSHVRIEFSTSNYNSFIFEAAGSSVRLIGTEGKKHYPVNVLHRYAMHVTDAQFKNLLSMTRLAGVKYGTLQAIGIGIQRIFNLKRNPWADGDYSFICSELVATFLFFTLQLQIPDDDLPDFELAGPKAIKDWLDAHPEIATRLL